VLGKDNAEALLYVGAFAPDAGERVGELTTRSSGSSWSLSEREILR
jgi:hypothetical protein